MFDLLTLRITLTLLAFLVCSAAGLVAGYRRGRRRTVAIPPGVPATAAPPLPVAAGYPFGSQRMPVAAGYPFGSQRMMELGLRLAPTGMIELTIHFPAEERLEVLPLTRHEARLLGVKIFDLTAAAAKIAEAARSN